MLLTYPLLRMSVGVPMCKYIFVFYMSLSVFVYHSVTYTGGVTDTDAHGHPLTDIHRLSSYVSRLCAKLLALASDTPLLTASLGASCNPVTVLSGYPPDHPRMKAQSQNYTTLSIHYFYKISIYS